MKLWTDPTRKYWQGFTKLKMVMNQFDRVKMVPGFSVAHIFHEIIWHGKVYSSNKSAALSVWPFFSTQKCIKEVRVNNSAIFLNIF